MAIESPPRPLPFRVLNGGYRAARRLGAHPLPLRKHALMARATRRARGLADFGDPRFEHGLDRLIESLESEDRLNGFGRILATSHITNLLRQRLLFTEHLRQHPEICDEVIAKPIFLVGAPRTGTTITHHLLSQDDRFRYPITWECDELHPPLDPATMRTDPRIKRSDKQIRRTLSLAPISTPRIRSARGRPRSARCCMPMRSTARLSTSCSTGQGYDRWLTGQDLTWVYQEQKLLLQYMQSGGLRPTESWLLKTPPHMENIDKILAVFPDARFVTTYREPTEIVASSCKLAGTVFGMVEDDVDWHDHGRYMRWRTGRMLTRNVELRRQYAREPKRFIDFPMDRMVRNPMSCVQEIYEFFGIELTDEAHRKMSRFMDARGMAKRKPNVRLRARHRRAVAAIAVLPRLLRNRGPP